MKRKFTPWEKRYPDQERYAQNIARDTAISINMIPRPKSAEVDYWRQGVLERVIELLQERV